MSNIISINIPEYRGGSSRRRRQRDAEYRLAVQIEAYINDMINRGEHKVVTYREIAARFGAHESIVAKLLYASGGSEKSIRT